MVDLVLGHIKALEQLRSHPGVVTYNLGTGQGYSVLEVLAAFEKATGKTIPYTIGTRRAGDVAAIYADASKAQAALHWTATRGLEAMCADMWRWQALNPQGYEEA